MLTDQERGDMAEELLPVACQVAVWVWGEGGPEDVRRVLAGLEPVRRQALLVVLAGLADPDEPLRRVPGWPVREAAWPSGGGPAPVAAELVALVHGEGAPRDVAALLEGVGEEQYEDLAVTLGGLVRPARPLRKALGWLDFDEGGELVVPSAWSTDTTVAELAETVPGVDGEYVDDIAVRLYLRGKPVLLTREERLEAVRLALRNGWTYIDLDVLHHRPRNDTATFISRLRRRYRADGREFPVLEHRVDLVQKLTDADARVIRERYAAGGTSELELSMAYGVGTQTISKVLLGKTFTSAGGPLKARRGGRPAQVSRVVWAGGDGRFAEAA
ncbi:hypothetical protein ABZ404_37100 [Streptomyces sp. NPDC005878]|uniref:hypothetical protein n=1 Tax=Streptomyces sp. NPDC005878 TaxID=3157077 RepID=UPI0033FF98BD